MHRTLTSIRRWFDSGSTDPAAAEDGGRIDWLRCVPFAVIHLGCLAVVWVGVSPIAVGVALVLYVTRMFAVTAFYHRYFSHRAFRTTRGFQLVMGILAGTAVQRGPIWWAAHHRHHHVHSDDHPDHHSPRLRGLLMSHMGWFMTRAGFEAPTRYVRDWLRFPELRFLDRCDWVVPVVFAGLLYALGAGLERWAPGLGTTGGQMLVWGFFISTVLLYHATYTINSLAHTWGRRRYATTDDSRNNLWLALLTLGEGWHNNHHRYPASVRQGFFWWEIDLSYYLLRALSWTGLIWDLRVVPEHVLEEGRAGAS
jgi:stearoyl-CoA desaturase (delta-9 desaturase)